jgi:hypothetical protein
VTLTRFRSFDDIRAFAGYSLDVAAIEPRAAELLSRYEPRALHFETSTFEVA